MPKLLRLRRANGVAARRITPAVALVGLAGTAVLTLGLGASLSGLVATITNTTNTASSAALAIQETSGATQCNSYDTSTSCGTINKYGGTGTPLLPGNSQSVTVTMANVGTATGALTLKAGGCSTTGGISTGSTDACGIVQVKAECPSGTAKYPASGTATLTTFGAAAAVGIGSLAKDATISCTFTVTLPSTASPTYAGQTLSQSLTWTLNATT